MRHFGLGALMLLATAGNAVSADLSSNNGVDWSGFSLGVFGGWQRTSIEQTELHTEAFGGGWWFPPGPNPGYDYDDDAAMFGVQLGYDRQYGNLVVGAGVEVGSMNIDTYAIDPNSPVIPIPGPAGPETSFEAGLFGSLTGRLGYASGRWLTYVRGGVSLLDAEGTTVDTCARSFCGQLTIDATEKDILLGVTAGAGIDYALSESISLGAEYRAYHFEPLVISGAASNLLTYEQDVTPDLLHTARVNLTFRF